MGTARGTFDTGLKAIRVESGRLILPSEIGARIENFVATPEGTLDAVRGPCPYVPDWGNGYPAAYGNMHGVFHTQLISGSREVLLIHTGQRIYNFMGSRAGGAPWELLVGESGAGGVITATIPDHTGPQFPCQFEATGTGVVIVPQNARAFFYDGVTIFPLGYDRAPAAPQGYGPSSSSSATGGDADGATAGTSNVNDNSYSVGRIGSRIFNVDSYMGYGRLGTSTSDVDGTGYNGVLDSDYQGAVQWIDYFGNLSPLSGRSSTLHIERQYDSSLAGAIIPDAAYQFWFYWRGIQAGPDGTVGRIFCRTKDTRHSGTNKLFVMPGNVGEGFSGAFATMPDNLSQDLSDNVPDGWLVSEPLDVLAVPQFKLCRVAFGRLWIANTPGNPGILIPSLPGRWGTFINGTEMFPDPTGGEITGMWTTQSGMPVCTATSTYIIVPSNDGKFFRAATLDSYVGCVAPSSFANLPDGSCVWLAQDGFYRFDGKTVGRISDDITPLILRLTSGRLMQACAAFDWSSREYRCWVPLDGSIENDLCLIYDGMGWRRRTGESLRAVCVTKDMHRYMVGVGRVTDASAVTRNGVWTLDHVSRGFNPATRTYRLETSWIEGARSGDRKSARMLYTFLRESANGTSNVQGYRDWRMGAVFDPTTGNTKTIDLLAAADSPPLWGTFVLGSTTAPNTYVKRRPYWVKEPLYLPDCEVYKLVISTTSRIEFIGLRVEEREHGAGSRVMEG